MQCYVCKKYGHTKAQCYYNDEANIAEEAKDAEEGNEESSLFMAMENSSVEEGDTWIIDSGCSNHMTDKKELFQYCEDVSPQTVKLRNGNVLKVSGVGTVSFRSSIGNASKVSQVQYVPELTHNLLSVGQLMDSGFDILFSKGKCNITNTNDNTLFASVQMSSRRLFPLKTVRIEMALCAGHTSNLWHRRYGHLNHTSLQLIKENHLVEGLTYTKSMCPCETCSLGKQTMQMFPKG